MNLRLITLGLLFGACSNLVSTQVNAEEGSTIRYALGTGVPYFLNAEIGSYSSQGGFYLSAGQGPDAGLTLGWERVISDNQKHSLGLVLGAVGVREGSPEVNCENESGATDTLGCVIGKSLASAFDWGSVYGAGASYGYSFSQRYQDAGWKFRFVAGYGENKHSKENEAAVSASLRYQF